ncbi:MFS transporter [Duganella violaceipulchra]|uniref:MFS family permease n=1 Tax=Duganella violaceipulchra TaxID=2849652 RepID=A0AA41H7T7_9BURK|nr:MFS transporter [Duganella violaceicalia]MBV6321391.1 MFS transporter [Duganella violaceicalia]MCP2009360.1 MFS family permease [Duganella violaceicalia]
MQSPPYAAAIFQPLRHARFRQLWLANLLSNLGSRMQAFAAAWQIASLSHSPQLTALVQTATWAPMLLFALPAGALADTLHRPTLLFRTNAVMALAAVAMALLSCADSQPVPALLLLTFAMGAGLAFTMPAWQASMSSLLPLQEVEAAATLNNLSYNLAALAGPALGAVLFQLAGAAPLYWFNALSFSALLWSYRQWRSAERPRATARAPRHSMGSALRISCASPRYRSLLLHGMGIFFVSAAFAALLPLLHPEAGTYGSLMGALGAGAVLAAVVLPTVRRHAARRMVLAGGLAVYGVMLATIGLAASQPQRLLLVVIGGVAWSAIVTTLNGAAQRAFPDAVRARTLSVHILAIAAGQTAGSAAWGLLAAHYGIVPALTAAGMATLGCAALVACSEDFLETP